MAKIFRKAAILGMLGLAALGGPRAQENQAEGPRATGLIPLDAAQIDEIVTNWPRITRVGVNRLGFERVNEVRAGKGKPPLDPLSVAPIGGEVESSLAAHAASTLAAASNAALAGDLPVSVTGAPATSKKFQGVAPLRTQNRSFKSGRCFGGAPCIRAYRMALAAWVEKREYSYSSGAIVETNLTRRAGRQQAAISSA